MAGWSGWASLGGNLGGETATVGVNVDGRLEVFSEGEGATGPELWHIWQTASNNGWGAWDNLGAPPGQFMGSVTAARNADGRLEVFTRVGLMSTGIVWHIWQEPIPATGWSGWSVLGSPPGGVAQHSLVAGRNADGRLELFCLGSGSVWHIWQLSPGGGWSGWDPLGAPAGASIISLALGSNADGRLMLAGVGTDGDLWERSQTSPSNGWGGWNSLGNPGGVTTLQVPAIGRNQDGRLEVFVTANPTSVWHIWQTAPGGAWSAWDNAGAPPGAAFIHAPAVAANADGRLELFVTEVGAGLWHIWQNAPGNGWSPWDNLGGTVAGGVAIGANSDGRLELFAESSVPPVPAALFHRWQTAPNNGWSFNEDWDLTGPTGPALQLFTPAGGDVFVQTQTGLYRSGDDAQTWAPVTLPPSPGRAVSVDPSDPNVIFAGAAGGLFRSTNGGGAWTQVLATPGKSAFAIAVSPADHNVVYLAQGQGTTSFELHRSVDGGASWTMLEGPVPSNLCSWTVLILEPHPTDPMRAFRTSGCYRGNTIFTGDSLDQTLDTGTSWVPLFHPVGFFPSRFVGGGGANPDRLYLGAHFGAPPGGGRLYRSDDDGVSWTAVLMFATGPSVQGLTYDPNAPDTVFAGLTTGEVNVSHDGGSTWDDLGRDGLGGIRDLALSLNGKSLYAASELGVWRLRR